MVKPKHAIHISCEPGFGNMFVECKPCNFYVGYDFRDTPGPFEIWAANQTERHIHPPKLPVQKYRYRVLRTWGKSDKWNLHGGKGYATLKWAKEAAENIRKWGGGQAKVQRQVIGPWEDFE